MEYIFVCRAAKQRGWWRITNPEVFKELNNCLNVRGIREKNLQKSFERHVNFAIQSCSKAKKNGLFLFFYFFTRVDIIAQCTSVGCFIPVLTTFKMSLCALLTSEWNYELAAALFRRSKRSDSVTSLLYLGFAAWCQCRQCSGMLLVLLKFEFWGLFCKLSIYWTHANERAFNGCHCEIVDH